ncbi:MAG: glycosyltransferase [Bacteroidaceae bacterium]|nr:glycosyltransferase [Bacteroidaceae bacterium]
MDNKSQIPISVIVTTYNAAAFIRETIDSILEQTFQNFELLIGDDESEDNTCEIIESYHDLRIRLVRCKHDFIGTENRMLYEAKGKYIARIDHDDIMMPNRLKIQYEYMEQHPEIDVLGGDAICFGNIEDKIKHWAGHKFTANDFLNANYICNSTSMLRRETIIKNHLLYKRLYIYADDYGFWTDMLKLGLHLENIPEVLVRYRVLPSQTSSIHADIQIESVTRVVSDLQSWIASKNSPKCLIPEIKVSKKYLTVIIPFLNEGVEVINTVKSIRQTVDSKVDIITINDLSTDGYAYEQELMDYDVYYVFNKQRKGVAASRDLGVQLCKTPYFILLDGHMRFYSNDWDEKLVSMLLKNDRQVLCCQGKALQKENGVVSDYPGCCKNFGAFFTFMKGRSLVEIQWNTFEYTDNPKEDIIPAILGAGYVASKRYWEYLQGLNGLLYYGSDEAYISIKTWLEGGRCVLVKDVVIGHIYRESSPYRRYQEVEIFNELLISYLLYPQSLHAINLAFFFRNNIIGYHYALNKFRKEKDKWLKLKTYYQGIFKRQFQFIIDLQGKMLSKRDNFIPRYDGILTKIADFLLKNIPEKAGLCEGKMGLLLWLSYYNEFDQSKRIDNVMEDLWININSYIDSNGLPFNFYHGLSGIGWGLIYLSDNNLLEDDIEYILKKIDLQLSHVSLETIYDTELGFGLGGYVAYYVARINYAKKHGYQNTYDAFQLKKIKVAAKKILENDSSLASTSFAFHFLWLLKYGYNNNEVPLNIRVWLENSTHIPQNIEYWNNALVNPTMNASLYIMMRMKIKKIIK